jgi:hypothetical protein
MESHGRRQRQSSRFLRGGVVLSKGHSCTGTATNHQKSAGWNQGKRARAPEDGRRRCRRCRRKDAVVVKMVVRGRGCDGGGLWWLGIHEPDDGGQAGSLCSIWPHRLRCVGVPCRVFSPKCPFDTRFLAPLAKVIHPAVHPCYRLSKVGATPPNDHQPPARDTPVQC